MKDKIKIFVSRHWPDHAHAVNGHIIDLIRRADMVVSEETKRHGVGAIETKMMMNVLNADAFCIIVKADEKGDLTSRYVQHEINIAKSYKIPSFVFVDRTEMGWPTARTNIEGLCFGLDLIAREWHEFYDKDLLDGKNDQQIHDWLTLIKNEISKDFLERRQRKALSIAALLTHELNLTPFDVGLKSLADAHDQDPAQNYNAAAKVAAQLTGAKLGFIGLLERESNWNKISIKGAFGVGLEERAIISSLKLGYNDKKQTEGLTGHVACYGEPYMVSDLKKQSDDLESVGIRFVNSRQKEKTNSALCIPIKLKDKVIGVINAEHANTNHFNEIHIIILQWLSNVIALAYTGNQLENFILELSDVALGKKKIGDTILNALLKFTQADYGFVAITNKETKICEVVAIEKRGLAEELIAVDPEKGLTGKVLREGVSAYVDDVSKDQEYLPAWRETRSEIVLPIINTQSSIVGIINLEFITPQKFEFIDKPLFDSMAKLMAAYISS